MHTFLYIFLLASTIGISIGLFFFNSKWRTLELMMVLTACSAVIAIVLKAGNDGRNPQDFRTVYQLLPYAVFSIVPILSGAYLGVRLANVVHEEKTYVRLLLIVVGWMYITSALAVIYTALLLMRAPIQDKIGIPESFLYSLGVLLCLPAYLVTDYYKQHGHAKEINEIDKKS